MSNYEISAKRYVSNFLSGMRNINMKRFIMKIRYVAFISLVVLGVSMSARAVPILSFDVSNPNPIVGDTVTVGIKISDVTDLYIFDIDTEFNPAILGVNSVSPGSFLGSGGALTLGAFGYFFFDTSTPGQIQNISDSILSFDPGVSGTGILASIMFDALSVGTRSLNFLSVNLAAGTELLNSSGTLITISSADDSVSPSSGTNPVPEPSTILLLFTGFTLLGLAGFHRSRKQQIVVT